MAALMLTLLDDTTAPRAMPVRPFKPVELAEVVFEMVEVMVASAVAVTSTQPAAVSFESATVVVAPDPTSVPKAADRTGSPIRASTALNRTFCGRQPMLLKARVTPTASVRSAVPDIDPGEYVSTADLAELTTAADRLAALAESTVTMVSAWRVLVRTVAAAAASRVLVAITPLMASDDPAVTFTPVAVALAATSLVVTAARAADSVARTVV